MCPVARIDMFRPGKGGPLEHAASRWPIAQVLKSGLFFSYLIFFACYEFLRWDEPFYRLDMSEEPEGNDPDDSIAWNRYYKGQGASDMSDYEQDDEYFQRF